MSDPMRALRVLTPEFETRSEVAGYTSLSLTRRHYGVGEFELHMPIRAPSAGEIGVDALLMPLGAPEKTMVVESLTREEGKGQLTLRGCTLDGIAKRRLAVPPPASGDTFGWDRVTGDAETVFKHYAQGNLAQPADPSRAIPRLVIAENLHRGLPGLAWQARFEALDAVFKGLGEHADLGWTIWPDIQGKRLVFDVAPGRELTADSPGGMRVVISLEMANAGEMRHIVDAASCRTTAYVGGQGQDEQRLILAVGCGSAGEPPAQGLERRETWVDGGGLELPEELLAAGRRRLSQTSIRNTIQSAVLQHGAFQYGRDFDLGDRVTLKTRTGRLDARAIEIREVYTRDRPVQLDVTFGDAPVTMTGVIGELRRAR